MSQLRVATAKDKVDQRDRIIQFASTPTIPIKVDLRALVPNIYNQQSLGSCTAHAVATLFDTIQDRQYTKADAKAFTPSRLFIYYNTRKIEGTTERDVGSSIRNAIKSVAKEGICDEELWGYEVLKFKDLPPPIAYENGKKNTAVEYLRLTPTREQLEQCLSRGNPFSFGLMIYKYWYDDPAIRRSGIIRSPTSSDTKIGGHAMVCVGYDRQKQVFIVVNSWGPSWGDKGICYIPYSYMLGANQSWDFWIIRSTSVPVPHT